MIASHENQNQQKSFRKEDSSSEFQVEDQMLQFQSVQSDNSQQRKKELRKIVKERIHCINRKKNHGEWSLQQEKKFLTFMLSNKSIIENQKERRFHKVFKMMAKYMKTRSSVQCRSHHQKLLNKCKNYKEIIEQLSNKIYLTAPISTQNRVHLTNQKQAKISLNKLDDSPKLFKKQIDKEVSNKGFFFKFLEGKTDLQFSQVSKSMGGQWQILRQSNKRNLVIKYSDKILDMVPY